MSNGTFQNDRATAADTLTFAAGRAADYVVKCTQRRVSPSPEAVAARRGLPVEDVAPAAMLAARAGVGA